MKTFRTIGDALMYLVDCELATLSRHLHTKSAPKKTKARHGEIAANGFHACVQHGAEVTTSYAFIRDQLPQPTLQFSSARDAIAYLTTEAEKTLAGLLEKKSAPKSEIRRYEAIASTGRAMLAMFPS